MIQRVLVDTGPLVALLDKRDRYHLWAKEQSARILTPMLTCEAVLAEAFHLLRTLPRARAAVIEMLDGGLLHIPFHLSDHVERLDSLLHQYRDVPISLADACLLRMSETVSGSTVFTIDSDFLIYRRRGRGKIPVLIPPVR